jgi:hypothetical protein
VVRFCAIPGPDSLIRFSVPDWTAAHSSLLSTLYVLAGSASDSSMRSTRSKDMHHMPPTTEPHSGNFLDETVFWIIAAEQEREAMRTHTSPRARHGRTSNTQFRARRFAESIHHPLTPIVSLQTGQRRLRHLPTATRLAVRFLSFRFNEKIDQHVRQLLDAAFDVELG